MKTAKRWHLRSSAGFYVGMVGPNFVWSKFSFWGNRFADVDEARKFARQNMAELARCFDALRVVRVKRRVKRLRARPAVTS